jgi:hypothetical protein
LTILPRTVVHSAVRLSSWASGKGSDQGIVLSLITKLDDRICTWHCTTDPLLCPFGSTRRGS